MRPRGSSASAEISRHEPVRAPPTSMAQNTDGLVGVIRTHRGVVVYRERFVVPVVQ
jgi:hypothetical protein